MQSILELARAASAETGAGIGKGSASGKAMEYQIRSCFAFASIGVAANQRADTSRITSLELRKDNTDGGRERFEALKSLWAETVARPAYAEGIRSRWGQQWPFDGHPLLAHPIARHAPDLIGPLGELREPLLRYVDPAAQVGVCHTDLFGAHTLVRDGRLAALMDFGDAAIVPVAFDLASFAYYHAAQRGWDALHTLLEGYEPRRVMRDVREAETYQLLVVLALQKVRKRTTSGEAALLGDAIEVLRAALPRAVRRDA